MILKLIHNYLIFSPHLHFLKCFNNISYSSFFPIQDHKWHLVVMAHQFHLIW